MKTIFKIFASFTTALWLPTMALADNPPDKLYGTWAADNVETMLGAVRLNVTFRREGPVSIVAWSTLPLVGKVRSTQGSYEVKNGSITSDSIHGGTSMEYWFDSGDLMLKYSDGKTVRLHRKD